MLSVLYPSLESKKFVDINKVWHHFPEEIKSIGFPVTLLHHHPHVDKNKYLLYSEDYKTSTYLSSEEAKNYSPCSWYLEEGKIFAY